MSEDKAMSPEEQALADLLAEAEAEEKALDASRAKASAAAAAPEAQMLAARLRIQEARALRERTERDAADAAEIVKLRAKHGARMGVIYTGAGSLVMVVGKGHAAIWDTVRAEANALSAAALEASPPDPVRAERDAQAAYDRAYVEKLLVYPADKAERRRILDEYPGAWPEMYALRADLARGPREAAGKGVGR
jgi:hypothetical protein